MRATNRRWESGQSPGAEVMQHPNKSKCRSSREGKDSASNEQEPFAQVPAGEKPGELRFCCEVAKVYDRKGRKDRCFG